MKKFEITKEQVRMIEPYYSAVKFWFPEAFKNELEVGKWYKTDVNLCFITDLKDKNKILGYGFDNINTRPRYWGIEDTIDWNMDGAVLATHQEVEAALIRECEKLGLVDGVHYLSPNERFKRVVKFPLRLTDDNVIVDANNYYIFDNGIWATIVERKKMTISEIENELGYSVEII